MYERKDIYDIAEYYQRELESRGLWDEIDLCRQAVRDLTRTRGSYPITTSWSAMRSQDFADIQLRPDFQPGPITPRTSLLTGDPKQIINPSGFRWRRWPTNSTSAESRFRRSAT